MRSIFSVLVILSLSSCALLEHSRRPEFLVFFTERSPTIDAMALPIIAKAAAKAKAQPDATVIVYGYTDSAGSTTADALLSEQRAQNVRDQLIADGVPSGRIGRHGRGQTGAESGVASRRVEIDIYG
jgi:outer membrane protein OmpA-like peptidoglycan-associated protein